MSRKVSADFGANQTIRFGLRFKVISAISIVLFITLGFYAYYDTHKQKLLLQNNLDNKVQALGQFLSLISPAAIYAYDITALDSYVRQVSLDSEIAFALIRSPEGFFLNSYTPENTSIEQISQIVKKNPYDYIEIKTFPIVDEGSVLGNVVIAFDKRSLDKIINRHFNESLAIIIGIIVLLISLIFIIFKWNILEPIQALSMGAYKVSQKNLDHRVNIYANDELGNLSRCFNTMIEEIANDREKLELAANVFTYAKEGITITDSQGNIIEVNAAFSDITGYENHEAIGKNPSILKSGRHNDEFYRNMWEAIQDKGHWSGEIWNKRKNGDIYPEYLTISCIKNKHQETTHYVALFTDITEQKKHQQQLEHIAHYDALTNLPNRILLSDRLHQAILQSKRRSCLVAIVYLDLDGFKQINDSFGHESGDDLLIKVSSTMKTVLREGDTIARIGGDEFVAILSDLSQQEDCIPLVERLNLAAAETVIVSGRELNVSASIGVSFYNHQTDLDAEQLLRQADHAMYQAKLSGKNRYHIFDAQKDENLRGINESINNIQDALNNHEFELYYQPKVNIKSGEVLGFEALIRWNKPQQGLVMPDEFLPLIADHDLSIAIDEWVLNEALNQLSKWQQLHFNTKISINIGASFLQQTDFITIIKETLEQYPAVSTQQIELEILETSALDDINKISEIIRQCDSLNIQFTLDDFGTGYSSLTYLKRLPASTLKIDKSFVKDMLDDPEDLAILEGIMGMSSAFGRSVIAEGVETEEHGIKLLFLNCQYAQGYAIARPMPSNRVITWQKEWKPYLSWANTDPLSSTDISILHAEVEHRSWVKSLGEYINGERIIMPELNHQACRFAQWLKTDGTEKYSQYQLFKEIEQAHTHIHSLASSILSKTNKDSDQIKEELNHLYQCRDLLISKLKQLITLIQHP